MKNKHLIGYKNPVIVKDEEGKVKPTTYDLPGESHAYGKKVEEDPQPIKRVVNGWQSATGAQQIPSKQKNFRELNKRSVVNGLHTAKHQGEFRKHNDLVVKTKKGEKMIPILLPEEQFTYGTSNRPSTPVKLIIGNCYALDEQAKNSTMYMKEAQQAKKKMKSAQKTKSQLLREDKAAKEKEYRKKPIFEDQFKMHKFSQNKIAKINTYVKPGRGQVGEIQAQNSSEAAMRQSNEAQSKIIQ